ncbi:M56 family metallopeptidase [Parapedobacter koreensis]|uniref:Signal transducer regulating beta-lactamase production, contains metallopeptidase domain n=1 Tax=Parapedobacter koreensis TaxID=332977 RepID=A0A1H7R2T4_9SPHI|nr:M56 family metallopeptidase [Parapedobacter koreensis]SEL54493.1 Signal transducer regulating beta-lactamase production, contains metallopeptidase domain [Parapedobacter koreensis]
MENFVPLIFNGLGWAIVHSLWVGAILYGSLMLVFQFGNWRAKTKSLLLAITLSVLLAFFCLTFLYGLIDRSLSASATITDVDIFLLQSFDYEQSVTLKTHIERYFPVVIAFYILGVFLQAVLVINGFRKLRIIRKQGLLDVPGPWKTLLTSIKLRLGLRTPIAFHLSTLVDVPMVVGHLKPIILFPMAVYTGMRMEQVEAVLIHELAHIKRNDYLINLIKTITETLLFFNPFVWLIGKALEMERENACDDVVVDLTAKPVYYARTLLWLEEQRQQPSPSLALQAVSKKKQLLHRIQRMTNMNKNYLNAKHKLAVLTLMLGCIASLAWVKPFIKDTAPTETAELLSTTVGEQTSFPADSAKAVTFQAVASDTVPVGKEPYITFIGKDSDALIFDKYEDLPDSLKEKVDHRRYLADSLRIMYSSSAWKEKMERMRLSKEERDKMTAQVHQHMDSLNTLFESKEWKEKFSAIAQNTDVIRRQTDSIRAYFDSSTWKDKLKAHADSLSAFFNSSEGKKARERLKQQLEENKINATEWREMIIQQDRITQRYLDSIRTYLNSPEWKSKMNQWNKESKGNDTTLVWPTMTITIKKHQEALASLQQQYASINEDKARRYYRVLEHHQKRYIDGSIKPWFDLNNR